MKYGRIMGRDMKKNSEQLPRAKKQKLINVEKFVELAKRVRKSFEKEQEYLEQQQPTHSNYRIGKSIRFS